MIFTINLGELYTSEKFGNDNSGDGTESKPFKTILQAMKYAGKEPFPLIYVDSKTEGEVRNGYTFFCVDGISVLINIFVHIYRKITLLCKLYLFNRNLNQLLKLN